MTTELEDAERLANVVLDKPFIDPDGDICMLARQFLRAREREARRASELASRQERIEELERRLDERHGPTSIDDVLDQTAARIAVAEWFKSPVVERSAYEVETFKRLIRRELLDAAVLLAKPYLERAETAESDRDNLLRQVEAAREALAPFAAFAEKARRFVQGRADFGGSPIMPTKQFRLADFERAEIARATLSQIGDAKC